MKRTVKMSRQYRIALEAALDSWYATESNIERAEPRWVVLARSALQTRSET